MDTLQAGEWAHQTFAGAALGDPRRVRRLVAIAAAVAMKPSGTVTGAVHGVAAKEGAFRWLESDRILTEAVSVAMFDSAASRCDSQTTFVAIDQTDLSFVDRKQVRGLGPVCYRNSADRRAMHVMNSLALDASGTTVGLVDQQMWLRPEEPTPGKRKYRPKGQIDRRAPEERESWKWVLALRAAKERLPSATQPWFVADRGADFHGFYCELEGDDAYFTVRSAYDRAIRRNGERRMLWSTLGRGKVQGRVVVEVPAGPNRRRRRVTLELRAITARVRVRNHPFPEAWQKLTCVRVREVGKPPVGESRIEWKLLSNHPLNDPADALAIFRSYSLRWRVEEFHKTWKTGACNVESSQLRSLDALTRWATILAAVATRIERLKQLSRERPDLDALQEFSREELDAAITLSCEKRHAVGDQLTMQQAVRLVAIVGGHMGRKGDGPPGSITIRRGLEQIVPAARVLAAARTSG